MYQQTINCIRVKREGILIQCVVGICSYFLQKPDTDNLFDSKFSSKDMDDTDGERFRSHLLKLWNTVINKVPVDPNQQTELNTQQVMLFLCGDQIFPRCQLI